MKWNGYWKRLCSFLLAAVLVLSLVPMHAHAAEEETTRTLYMDLSAYEPDSYGEPVVYFYDENNSELSYDCSMEGNFDVCVVSATAKYYKIEKGHAGGGDEPGDYPELPANVDTYIHPTGWSCMHRAGFVDNVCTTCGGEQIATVDDTVHCDFASALADWADGGTLTLLKDVTTSKSISLGVDGADWVSDAEWVLDLNGKMLDLGNVKSLVTYGELTVQNGTLRAIVIVDDNAGALVLDDVQLLNSRDGNNALLVYGTPIVSIINSSLIGGVLYTESLVEAYGNVQFDSTYGLYMVGNGAVRFHQTPTAVLPLKVQTPAEGKAYVMAGTDVTLTADQFTSTVTGYKTTVLADGSIGLTVCDHPESEKGYVYLNQDTHKTVCSLCHFESNNTEAAPHTVSNGVCTACGGRQIFVDASYFTSVTNEMLYYYIGSARTGAAVKKDDAGYYTTIIPAETGKVYWLHGLKYAECKSEETQLPADKNCMRITGRDSATGLFTVIWYNHPHEHTYSSETKCCTECLLPCTHSWGGDAVCDSCGYTCTHSMHSQYGGWCQTCGLTAEHTFDAFGNCTGQICGAECSHPSLDAQGLCPDCGMRKIYLVGVSVYVYEMLIRHDMPGYYYKNMTQESAGVFSGFMPVGVEGMYFYDYSDDSRYTECFAYDGTHNAFRVIGVTADGYAALHPFNYPCTHTYTGNTGVCDLCLEPCAHGSWNADGDVCAICGYTCLHDQGYSDGKCKVCGKACEHAQYAHGSCTTCGTICAEHQLDAQGFCTVCDMREIYVATKNWDRCSAEYNAYSQSRSKALKPVEDVSELYRGMIPDQVTSLWFVAGGGSKDIMTDSMTLPEDTSLNCFYVTELYASDEYAVYYSGIWGTYPCVHDWQDGKCAVCQEVCYHLEYDGPGDAYACTNCGYICPHAEWSPHSLKCTKCYYKCEAHGGHVLDAMGACSVCNGHEIYVDTTEVIGWGDKCYFLLDNVPYALEQIRPGLFRGIVPDNASIYFSVTDEYHGGDFTVTLETVPENVNCLRVLAAYDELTDSGNYARKVEWTIYCEHENHTADGCAFCGSTEANIHSKSVFTVSENGATVTVTCATATCGKVLETITLQAPAYRTYGESESPLATMLYNGETITLTQGVVYYIWENGQWSKLDEAPTNAGTYRVEASNVGAENDTSDDFTLYVEYTIAKAVPVVTPPVGAENLVYTGESFSLLQESGNTTGGTLLYAVTDSPDDTTEWVATLENAVWNAGTYHVWYRVAGNENHESVEQACIAVEVAEQTLADTVTVQLAYGSTVYDGTAKEPAVTVTMQLSDAAQAQTLTTGQDYTVQYENNVNAGTATVTITGLGNFSGTVTKTFEIQKATIRLTEYGVDGTLTYNGSAQMPRFTHDAETVNGQTLTVTFATSMDGKYGPMPSFTDAGTYSIYCKFSAPNHEDDIKHLTLQVKPATNNWLIAPVVEDWTYGKEAKITVPVPQFGECTVIYEGANAEGVHYYSTEQPPTDSGAYTVIFTVAETANYSALTATVDFAVEKAVCDLSGVAWDYTDAFVYDGLNHTVAIDEATLPEGAFVSTYTGHTASAIGSYQAAAAIEYDGNHTGEATLLLNWRIANNWTPVEYTVSKANEYGWYNQLVVITAAEGYQISLTDTAEGEWGASMTAGVEGQDSSITFYLRDELTGAISLAEELVYDLDMTAPTGTAALNDRAATDSLNESILFDLLYNEVADVTLTAVDECSGIADIAYAVSEAALTAQEVMAIEAWTAYNGTFGVETEDGKQFVVYVRITDKAGNVTYLCSEGAEYDTTAPVIEGIADGMTYYTTKNVTVSDKNLDTVTLNGEEAETAFSLKGNREAEYVIVAVDKAGNETVITVKTAPISQMAEVLEDLTEENVTSDNLEELEELADAADELLQDADLTEEEKAELEAVEEKAEALLEAIGDAQSAVDTEAIDKTLDITEENVKLSDKADLEGAKEDLGKALENYGDNYTEEEKDAIKEQLQQIEDALTAIENVEATEAAIKALPDKVAPDELDQAEKILAAKAAYDALSAYEKSLISDDAKENLDSLVASLTDYAIISGDGSVWTVGSDGTITIVSNGAFSKFIGVKVNGTLIDAANYDAKSGSTIITLKTSYLKTLDKGEHTMTILFTDGEVSAIFKIAQEPETPPTGDNTMVVLWTVTMLIGSGAVYVLLLDWKKRFYNTK